MFQGIFISKHLTLKDIQISTHFDETGEILETFQTS